MEKKIKIEDVLKAFKPIIKRSERDSRKILSKVYYKCDTQELIATDGIILACYRTEDPPECIVRLDQQVHNNRTIMWVVDRAAHNVDLESRENHVLTPAMLDTLNITRDTIKKGLHVEMCDVIPYRVMPDVLDIAIKSCYRIYGEVDIKMCGFRLCGVGENAKYVVHLSYKNWACVIHACKYKLR